MSRFYSNENFPRLTVEKLRQLGHDVLTSLEAGNANQRIADEAVLAYATAAKRTVLTINRRDFVALHLQAADHAGILVCSIDPDFEGQANRINEAVSPHASLHGLLIRVNRPDRRTPGEAG